MAAESGADSTDREWLAELFAQFSLPLTRFAIRRVGDGAAGDVVSETFLVAWRRLDDIPRDRPGPWLFATAAYVIQHELRGSQRRTSLVDRAAQAEATEVGADDHASVVAERLLVHQTLGQLSEGDQEVLLLTEWDQLSPSDAAAVLGCSVAAVKVRLHRARRRFAAHLAAATAGESADDSTRETTAEDDYVGRLLNLSPVLEDGGTGR